MSGHVATRRVVGRLPQFGIVEDFFSTNSGIEVLRARYDEILETVDSRDPGGADRWLEYARVLGVSERDLAHFFEHWLGLSPSGSGTSESAYFPTLDPKATLDAIVDGFIEALRAGRAHDLPLSVVFVFNDDVLRVSHVVTGAAVVVVISAAAPEALYLRGCDELGEPIAVIPPRASGVADAPPRGSTSPRTR